MGRNSGIAWTDHTANAWWGCHEVSPACDFCYARHWDHRTGGDHWGETRLRINGFAHAIRTWDAEARRRGVRERVFIQSMSDLFEAFDGPITERKNKVERIVPGLTLDDLRLQVWDTLRPTTNLIFLLLTKRPENIRAMLPTEFQGDERFWLGTTVETSAYFDRVFPLLSVPSQVHFVSVEPQLEGLDLSAALGRDEIQWVINGGESKQGSGHIPRPFHIDWARSLLAQCRENGAAFFMKQLGSRVRCRSSTDFPVGTALRCPGHEADPSEEYAPILRDPKGGDPCEWPVDLRVQELPR